MLLRHISGPCFPIRILDALVLYLCSSVFSFEFALGTHKNSIWTVVWLILVVNNCLVWLICKSWFIASLFFKTCLLILFFQTLFELSLCWKCVWVVDMCKCCLSCVFFWRFACVAFNFKRCLSCFDFHVSSWILRWWLIMFII